MPITFFLGGIKSGKSLLAQKFAEEIYNNQKEQKNKTKLLFIATACYDKNSDNEMNIKIQNHIKARGNKWQTFEEYLDLDKLIISKQTKNAIVVVDCLNMWLTSNLMFEYASHNFNLFDKKISDDKSNMIFSNIKKKCDNLLDAISNTNACELIIVGNEVGLSLVDLDANIRNFCNLLGDLNQKISTLAHQSFFVVAGCKVRLEK